MVPRNFFGYEIPAKSREKGHRLVFSVEYGVVVM
ncbi:hypothetical protein C5167_026577 [Papaver somniferum]|nr:hypothetical protein C5167_026577 [Papaver somniferum]